VLLASEPGQEKQGLPDLLQCLAKDGEFAFSVVWAAFAMALQRLCVPGSDLSSPEWFKPVEAAGFINLAQQHFYPL
jgi:hypothetical protein